MNMTDVQKEESQKTVVSFIFGLLIGGLLVFAFMGGDNDHKDAPKDQNNENKATSTKEVTLDEKATTDTAPVVKELPVGEGKVTVADTKAGREVKLSDVTFPIEEGWIGVREYTDGKMGFINGVIRFSKAGGVVPESIPLVTPTVAGREYAIMMYTSGGDKSFNSATDKQLDTIFATFKAE
jgi:hypothetical protein